MRWYEGFLIGSFYLNFFTVQHSVPSVLERKPVAKDVPQAERATCKNSVETNSVEKNQIELEKFWFTKWFDKESAGSLLGNASEVVDGFGLMAVAFVDRCWQVIHVNIYSDIPDILQKCVMRLQEFTRFDPFVFCKHPLSPDTGNVAPKFICFSTGGRWFWIPAKAQWCHGGVNLSEDLRVMKLYFFKTVLCMHLSTIWYTFTDWGRLFAFISILNQIR